MLQGLIDAHVHASFPPQVAQSLCMNTCTMTPHPKPADSRPAVQLDKAGSQIPPSQLESPPLNAAEAGLPAQFGAQYNDWMAAFQHAQQAPKGAAHAAHLAVSKRNAEMLQLCELALEQQASSPAAVKCLRLVGQGHDLVVQRWLSNLEGIAAISQDVRQHNAAFDRKRVIAATFSALGSLSLRREQAEHLAGAVDRFHADCQELHSQRSACLAALQQVR